MAKHADATVRPVSVSSLVEDTLAAEEDRGQTDEPEVDEAVDYDGAEVVDQKGDSRVRTAIAVGAAVVVALVCLSCWLGYRTLETRHLQAQRDVLVEGARQGAVNLTTIDYSRIDSDIQRILDSSTGSFHDDFQKGSGPFVAAVKAARSKSVGTVTSAGLESQHGDQANVLVTVSMKTSNNGAPEQEPRAWRMRIGVQKVGDSAKVSAVTFVP